jgi:hypothetical protein
MKELITCRVRKVCEDFCRRVEIGRYVISSSSEIINYLKLELEHDRKKGTEALEGSEKIVRNSLARFSMRSCQKVSSRSRVDDGDGLETSFT